jgi:hypothetical protein
MAINFPDSPTNGQVALVGGKNYTYNSTKNTWTPTQVTEADLSTVGSTTVVATHDLLPASPSAGDMALVSSVNKMYVYFLSGWWLMSSLQNASPSGITGNAAIYDLAADGTPTTVTLSSSDPEGFPIVWSHSVISGSLGGTTVTNVNNVFTITPSTTEADAGTFTLRFAASDGQGGESGSQSQFTLDFVFIVANSRYTTLLTTAVDTSDNNNITDASSNNHTITVNGDAYAGTFSPYRSGGYSTSFDGTGNTWYKFPTSTDFWLTDQSFHIGFWCYPKVLGDYDTIITQMGTMAIELLSGSMRMWLGTGTNGTWNLLNAAQISNTLNVNEWAYITVVRDTDNNTLKSYHNGTLVYNNTSFTGTVGDGSSSLDIGKYNNSNVNSWDGYIRDLRFRVGTGSENTSNAVPTEPITSEDSLTKLLTCHSPIISDGSSSARTPEGKMAGGSMTAGWKVTEPVSPYDYNEYSAADHGGSVHYDESGDYLSLPAAPTLGTSDFEISMWVYPEAISGDDVIIDFRPPNTNGTYVNLLLTNGVPKLHVNGDKITGSSALLVNAWSYLTLTRVSGSTKLYVNGTQTGSTYSDSNNYLTASSRPTIGQAGFNPSLSLGFNGHMSDLIVKLSGNSSPSVPTAPLSSSGTALHIKGADASIIDKSQVNNIKMNGPTTGSTTKSAFGSEPTISFMSGSNSNRYLNFDPTVLKFMEILGQPSIPFTIEGIWGWQGSTASPIFEIFQDTDNFFYFGGGPGGTQSGITTDNNLYAIFKIGGVERFKMTAGIGSYNSVGSSFKHQAITRNSSGVMQHYYDGQLRANTITHSGYDTVNWASPVGYVGRSDWMGIYGRYEGYIHQIRLTVGLARYTANFTAPTESLKG